jgi:Fic family protein
LQPFKNFDITSETLRTIAELDEFKGRWEALGRLAPERLRVLRRVATVESIGSSTRIEGAKLTDGEVQRLLSSLRVHSFRSRDEQEVAGYAEAMELVFESWRQMELTENHIKQLHGTLLRHSTKDERHRGQYKTLPNKVEAFDSEGRSLGVIFETASPFDTPRLMETLLRWTRETLAGEIHHPLLVIAVFVVRFLAIHPFQDGNGRLSRVLTTLLLLKEGYTYVPYSSLERVIEDNKDAYYLALRRAQATLDKNETELAEWITFFLECLATQKNALQKKVDQERLMASLSPLSAQLLRQVPPATTGPGRKVGAARTP